jgi:hypothetical protein
MQKTLLLDIILPNDKFLCQLAYRGRPKMMIKSDRGKMSVYDAEDLKDFVLKKRPTLKHVDFRIELTDRRL